MGLVGLDRSFIKDKTTASSDLLFTSFTHFFFMCKLTTATSRPSFFHCKRVQPAGSLWSGQRPPLLGEQIVVLWSGSWSRLPSSPLSLLTSSFCFALSVVRIRETLRIDNGGLDSIRTLTAFRCAGFENKPVSSAPLPDRCHSDVKNVLSVHCIRDFEAPCSHGNMFGWFFFPQVLFRGLKVCANPRVSDDVLILKIPKMP